MTASGRKVTRVSRILDTRKDRHKFALETGDSADPGTMLLMYASHDNSKDLNKTSNFK